LDTEQDTRKPITDVAWPSKPAIVEVEYRSFDRQYIIADNRLLHRASPDLWAARSQEQVFLVEFHSRHPKSGPGLIFSSLIPDKNSFKGSNSGRILPIRHPDGEPNTAPRLLAVLSQHLGKDISVEELTAYVA